MIAFAEGTVLHIQRIQREQSKRAVDSDKVEWNCETKAFVLTRRSMKCRTVLWPTKAYYLAQMFGFILSPHVLWKCLTICWVCDVSVYRLFFSWRVKADHPLRVRVRDASYGGACKMLSRGISLHELTFFLQTLYPLNCRSADAYLERARGLYYFTNF